MPSTPHALVAGARRAKRCSEPVRSPCQEWSVASWSQSTWSLWDGETVFLRGCTDIQYLVGGNWLPSMWFSQKYIGFLIIPIDFHSYFSEGWVQTTTNQVYTRFWLDDSWIFWNQSEVSWLRFTDLPRDGIHQWFKWDSHVMRSKCDRL